MVCCTRLPGNSPRDDLPGARKIPSDAVNDRFVRPSVKEHGTSGEGHAAGNESSKPGSGRGGVGHRRERAKPGCHGRSGGWGECRDGGKQCGEGSFQGAETGCPHRSATMMACSCMVHRRAWRTRSEQEEDRAGRRASAPTPVAVQLMIASRPWTGWRRSAHGRRPSCSDGSEAECGGGVVGAVASAWLQDWDAEGARTERAAAG